MRGFYHFAARVLASGVVLMVAGSAARADLPGRHPAYVHALSNLRAAIWMLEHSPGNPAVSAHEDAAIHRIEAAFQEIKQAAVWDGKDLRGSVPPNIPPDYRGRLHQAIDLLREAHGDLAQEEDDPDSRGLQHRAIEHVDGALHEAEHAAHELGLVIACGRLSISA